MAEAYAKVSSDKDKAWGLSAALGGLNLTRRIENREVYCYDWSDQSSIRSSIRSLVCRLYCATAPLRSAVVPRQSIGALTQREIGLCRKQ